MAGIFSDYSLILFCKVWDFFLTIVKSENPSNNGLVEKSIQWRDEGVETDTASMDSYSSFLDRFPYILVFISIL